MHESIGQKGSIKGIKEDIAELLDSGYAVSSTFIREMLVSQGLSPKSITEIFGASGRFEELTGVPVTKTKYKGVNVYYDPRLDLERDTDFSEVRKDIDQGLLIRARKR